MANYNFYANYGSPQGGGRGQDQLSQILQLYRLVQDKREKQMRDIDKWGTELNKNAQDRGKLEMYRDQSQYISNFLDTWDQIDNQMTTNLYSKLGKGSLSKQDLVDSYRWQQDRIKAFTFANSIADRYQKDRLERSQLDKQSRGQYIYKNSDMNIDYYFQHPGSMDSVNNGTTSDLIEQDIANFTRSVMTQLESDIKFQQSGMPGVLKVIKQSNMKWDDVLNTAIENGGPEVSGQAQKLLGALKEGIDGIKENLEYDTYDDAGKQKINNAIYQGVFKGMVPKETSTMSDPNYERPSTMRTREKAIQKEEQQKYVQDLSTRVMAPNADVDGIIKNVEDREVLEQVASNIEKEIKKLSNGNPTELTSDADVKKYMEITGKSIQDILDILYDAEDEQLKEKIMSDDGGGATGASVYSKNHKVNKTGITKDLQRLITVLKNYKQKHPEYNKEAEQQSKRLQKVKNKLTAKVQNITVDALKNDQPTVNTGQDSNDIVAYSVDASYNEVPDSAAVHVVYSQGGKWYQNTPGSTPDSAEEVTDSTVIARLNALKDSDDNEDDSNIGKTKTKIR